MTSSGKVRIYELSRDLGLENKDVLDAAEKLGVAAKSHSSSISDDEASRIRSLIETGSNGSPAAAPAAPTAPPKAILSVKKAGAGEAPHPSAPAPAAAKPATAPVAMKPAAPAAPAKPVMPPARPVAATPSKPAVVAKPALASKPPVPSKPAPPAKPAAAVPGKPAPAPSKPAATPNKPAAVPAKPVVIASKPARPVTPTPARPATPAPAPTSRKPELPVRPAPSKPQLVGRPTSPGAGSTSSRPAPPAGRAPLSQRPAPPQRPGAPAPTRPGQPGARQPGAPGRPGPTPLELVGKPIRRDTAGPGTPGAPGRPAAPGRPGMPAGMRKPMAPGELMQLQKPSGRPTAPPPRRPGDRTEAGGPGGGAGAPDLVRPSATPPAAPRRPGFRAPTPAGAAGRPRRPDWDDSAKLEALRSRTPQKQRTKVHIIGENDDALTAETGGYAGEQEAFVLQASLARPAKPRAAAAPAAKPMAAMRKRKKETTRQRQRRRAMELRASREAKAVRPEMLIVPEGNLTVQELAEKLGVESSEIIKSLFFKGIIATVTQSLDLSTIEAVAEEFGVPVLEDDVEEAAAKTVEMIEASDLAHLIRRPPVVTVMGHVDHGKTSLLDAIRKTRVAAGEAGGITQHIGAYQVEIPHAGEQRKITFLDTPGHEAFTAMRARGTKVTDVAVLVVAADDGVRPQTLEAISHARAAKVPIVVAINKIDKEGASPDRVKQELSGLELVAEDWGGDTVMVPVSAIKGENVDKLLEMILLVTEVEDLQANPDRMARGTVIEAHLDKAKGPVATLLVQNGTLRAGDVLAAGPVLGKVRAMVDDSGKRVKEAGPSYAVEALGFSEVPTAGDEFEVYPDEKTARSVVGDRANEARATRLAQQMASRRVSLASMSGQASEGELKELNLILKADVQGSVEAILGSLEQLPQGEVQVRVLLSAPGEITETDVDLAAASGAVIVGFNTSMAPGAKRAADATGVDVRDYDVIYKLLEDIQLAMEGLLEPELVEEPLGEAEVRAVFTIGRSAVAGCYVTTGKLQRNCKVRVWRGKDKVFEGDLDSLRRNKDDVKEVATGFECGIGTDRYTGWQEGDRVEAFKLVTQRRTLST
ncbi:translation initiation factor IF-2 [Cyanobium sp. FACHB-13342]|uniref:translation initiation factor IF-2 n=1 Tax=Cyanobium sp. FACHB-13342 TaxID=2692793 RepID=UPI0016803CD5|nr:translation initiation factor IF-2 [Cyanobium sp. FACHB-13342]MBD2423619.1 translation initiation factor IF-2 [Cyanobium sp. FACHB-13342]